MDRSKLKDELIRDEGKRSHCYKDSVGLYTIGVGHLLGETPRMLDVTEDELQALLDRDIDNAEAVAWSYIKNSEVWDNEVRSRAAINMAFNLGNRIKDFKEFLLAVNRSEWEKAAAEMLDSKWAKQVGARAKRLAQMIATGEEIIIEPKTQDG